MLIYSHNCTTISLLYYTSRVRRATKRLFKRIACSTAILHKYVCVWQLWQQSANGRAIWFLLYYYFCFNIPTNYVRSEQLDCSLRDPTEAHLPLITQHPRHPLFACMYIFYYLYFIPRHLFFYRSIQVRVCTTLHTTQLIQV